MSWHCILHTRSRAISVLKWHVTSTTHLHYIIFTFFLSKVKRINYSWIEPTFKIQGLLLWQNRK
uniref:Uncharacterized protein n=1 Tax=Anguilla anguilla TaxID=7936 RepID=A0A0E9XKZ3_ANGAN